MRAVVISLLLLTTQVFGQTVNGRVVDLATNEGIGFAHIVCPQTFKGTIADEQGYFKFNPQLASEKVIISCVGYKDTVVLVEHLHQAPIALDAASIPISEVTIRPKQTSETLLGVKQKRPNDVTFNLLGSTSSYNWTLFFPYQGNGLVKSFAIHLRRVSQPNISMRVRILSPDTTFSTLGTDLLSHWVELPNLTKGWNEIDLTNYHLDISPLGLIVNFSFTNMSPSDVITVSGTGKTDDYNWVSSMDYTKDFPLVIQKQKLKPAVRLKVVE